MPGKNPTNQTNTIQNFFGSASSSLDTPKGSPKRKKRTQGINTSPSQQSPETKKLNTRDEDTEMADSQPPGAEVLEIEIDPGPENPTESTTDEHIPEETALSDKDPHNSDQNDPESKKDERISDKQDNEEAPHRDRNLCS